MPKRDKSFHDYVLYDLFGGLDGVTSKPMFSGWGIYKNGRIFAVINESELFAKGSEETGKIYESRGGERFTYAVKNRREPVKLPYWSVPEDVLENREALMEWIRLATKN